MVFSPFFFSFLDILGPSIESDNNIIAEYASCIKEKVVTKVS